MDLNKPGIYHGVSDETYHELTHVSRSDAQLILRSPAHYWAQRRDPDREKKEATPAQLTGKILHTCILEPNEFDDHYVVVPSDAPNRPSQRQRDAKSPSPNTLFAIDWWDSFSHDNQDKQIITADQWDKCKKTSEAVRRNPELNGWLTGGHAEITIIAQDPVTGIMLRARPDYLTNLADMAVMIDIKSAEDARAEAFMRNAWNYGYFHQHIWYRDCYSHVAEMDPDLFLLAAFEKEPPYAVKLYEPAEDSLERARRDNRRAIDLMASCLHDDHWPSYSTDIERLHMPGWVTP